MKVLLFFFKPMPRYLFVVTRILFLFLIYTICRTAFYLYNLEFFPAIEFNEILSIYWGGLRFDLTGILYLNLIYIMAIVLPFRFVTKAAYQNWMNRLFLFFNSLGIMANCMDIAYYKFSMHRTTGSVFKIFENEEASTLFGVFLNGIFDFWPVTLLLILLLIALFKFTKLSSMSKSNLANKEFYSIYGFSIFLAFYLSIIGIRSGFGLKHVRPLAINNAGQYVSETRNIALVLNTPFSILRTLKQATYKRRNYFPDDKLENIMSPVKQLNPDGPLNKKNVMILIIESLSKEHSKLLNPDLEDGQFVGYTPFLDSLMQHSLTFTNAYANGHKSIDGMPSILTGIPSILSHYLISNYSTNEIEGIGKILEREGYDQAFFHGAPNGSMGFNAYANLIDIDKYFGMTEYGNSDDFDGTWGIWDEEFMQYMAEEMGNLQEPFHVTYFSLSSHHPSDLPEKHKNRFLKGQSSLTKVVEYTDYAIRRFFDKVKHEPWYENTIFAITADHAAFPYHDVYKTSKGIYEVPIFFYTPDGSLKGFDHKVAQQLDIFPTILDHLNIETKYFSFGSSLLDSTSTRYAVNYHRNGSYQFYSDSLLYRFKGKKRELFKYHEDPFLKKNLFKDRNFALDTLAHAVIQQFVNRMIDNRLTSEN